MPAKGSKKTGYTSSGKPLLVAVTDGVDHEKMLKDLFDPMKLIGHKVCTAHSSMQHKSCC